MVVVKVLGYHIFYYPVDKKYSLEGLVMFNQGLFLSVMELPGLVGDDWQAKVDICHEYIKYSNEHQVAVPEWFEEEYKHVPEDISRFVSNKNVQTGICQHTVEERKAMWKAHKWAELLTVCHVPNCKHTGRSLQAICNQGVQNNEQRSRPFYQKSKALTAFDAAAIW